MADIAVQVDRVRILDTSQRFTTNTRADGTITRGQTVYQKTNNRVALAKGDAVATSKVIGIATNDAKVGDPLTVLERGRLAGFGLASIDTGTTVYLSADNAGGITATAPTTEGQVAVPLGAVRAMTDGSNTKYILFDISQAADPAAIPAEV